LPEKSKKMLIIGAGGHARAVIDAAECCGYTIEGIIDVDYRGVAEQILGYPVIGGMEMLDNYPADAMMLFIAIGKGKVREVYHEKISATGFQPATILHPTAIVSQHAEISAGVLVNTGAIINAGAIVGENAIINTGAILEHEVKVGCYSHIGPGVRISGRVTIGKHTLVGIGASVIEKLTIGDHVMIGAGAVVIRDVQSFATVVGVPGKKVK
jgi:UDP-perosamine 4-acetyltransferase